MAYGQGVLKKDGSVIEYHGTEIKKLIVNEGVTGIGGSLCYNLPYLKSVFLPESVTKIGTGCFAECTSLQEVTLPSNLQTIAYDVFKNCYSLQKVTMPSNLNHIGTSTFENCKNLKEILLPERLKEWNYYILRGCPALEIIINDSKIPCYMPWYKKYVTWRVDGKKTKTIPAGKTGTSTRKKLSIQYDLRGGQETKKLPRTYRFGDSVTLPETVKRKGYVFMGWSDKMYADVEKVESGQKKAKFYATWYKYKVESKKTGTATVSFDSSQAKVLLEAHAIRYSVYKDMSRCDEKYCNKSKGKVRIKHLEPGKTYYFEICGVRDPDHPFEKWRAKRKVSICG